MSELEEVNAKIKKLIDEVTVLRRKRNSLAAERGEQLSWVLTSVLGPILKDAVNSGISVAALELMSGVSDATIYSIMNQRNKRTSEEIADLLLTALDKSHLLGNVVPVVVLPHKPYNRCETE